MSMKTSDWLAMCLLLVLVLGAGAVGIWITAYIATFAVRAAGGLCL